MEVIPQLDEKYTGVFIFLHGLTRNGRWQKEMFLDYLGDKASFQHIKVLIPTSQECFSKAKGKVTNMWFDISDNMEVATDGLKVSVETLSAVINEEVKNGIPLNRIVIGGISLGGMMAAYLAYCVFPEVAGCLLVSSAIVHEEIFEIAKSRTKNPPLHIYYGTDDELIPIEPVRKSFQKMKEAGVSAEFHEYPGARHELTPEELKQVYEHVKLYIPLVNEL